MKKSIELLIILCFAITSNIIAQTKTINGTVTASDDGQPLPGVNIIVKGLPYDSRIGTITDLDGKYVLVVPDSLNVIEFMYMGFETQEVTIDGRTVIDVVLQVSTDQLDEVVVVGYGVQKKSLVTGAVMKISANELNASKNKKSPKTWKRSNKSENAVRLSVGDDESDTLALLATEMKVTIDGFRARVLTNYFFYNDYGDYEGTFKIRLPAGASPYYFAFGATEYLNKEDEEADPISFEDYYDLDLYDYIDNDSLNKVSKQIFTTKSNEWKQPKEAKVVPVEIAAHAYSETVKGDVDPMLAEWGGADVFNCRVFPLEDDHVHRIVVGYDVNLTNIGHDKVFNLNIPKTSVPTKVDIEVAKLKDTQNIISYKKGIEEDDKKIKLLIENSDTSNIEIRYKQPENILLYDDEEKYFASSITVNLPKKEQENSISNAVFALDVSASSNPDKFNVWLKLLKATLLNNQQKIKHFNVMFFNIETFWFKDKYVKNTPENVDKLIMYCNKLTLEGATDIGAAIGEVCKPGWLKAKSRKNVFLMSDGSVTWGKEELYSISSQIDKNSIIYVYNTGISGTDMNVLEHIARESGGSLFSVTGEDEIDAASTAFNFEAWQITDVKLSGCKDILIAGRPKYLFPGQKIIVCGRGIPKEGSAIKLKLESNDQKQELSYHFKSQLKTGLSKRIYGQVAVNQIETFDFLSTKHAVPYAVYYSVPGKTCSMLMLENESDYKDFNIILEKDSALVYKTQVNKIVADLLKELEKSTGFEKDKLIKHLKNLEGNELVRFEFTDTLKKMLKKIPSESFVVNPSILRCENHMKNSISDSVLVELAKENPKNGWIEEEADRILKEFGKNDALKMLSTIVERNPNNGVLIRDVAFSALRLGLSEHAFYLLKKVTEKAPHQPHAYHFIAQILSDMGKPDLAMIYYEIAYSAKWDDDYEDIKAIVGVDYFRFLQNVKKTNKMFKLKKFAKKREKTIKSYLISEDHDMEVFTDSIDLMITMNWNTDDSDIDLHVIEPNGEECYYKHDRTESGGQLSNDATEGFGPEMYVNQTLLKGEYNIRCKYYDPPASRATTRTQVYVVVYENWGKKNERITRKVVPLIDSKEIQDVFKVKLD